MTKNNKELTAEEIEEMETTVRDPKGKRHVAPPKKSRKVKRW